MDEELRWYENPETGGVFGFGDPLPASIVDQIEAGKLRPCAPPEDLPASADSEADGEGGAGEADDGEQLAVEDEPAELELPEPEFDVAPQFDVEPEKPRRGGRKTGG